MPRSTIKPHTFFLIGLLIFGLLGSEFLVFTLSRLVDGRGPDQLFSWPVNWYAAIFHWTVTILIWAAGAMIVYHWVNKDGSLSELARFKISLEDRKYLIVGIAVMLVYELVFSWMNELQVPQVWREFLGFQSMYANQAWIVTLFQNLYYLMEFVLVVMMLAFFQKAGELWFNSTWFPWGGIGLALTWGSIHLVTNPQGAVGVILWALLLGVFFVWSKKQFLLVWLVGVLGFLV